MVRDEENEENSSKEKQEKINTLRVCRSMVGYKSSKLGTGVQIPSDACGLDCWRDALYTMPVWAEMNSAIPAFNIHQNCQQTKSCSGVHNCFRACIHQSKDTLFCCSLSARAFVFHILDIHWCSCSFLIYMVAGKSCSGCNIWLQRRDCACQATFFFFFVSVNCHRIGKLRCNIFSCSAPSNSLLSEHCTCQAQNSVS